MQPYDSDASIDVKAPTTIMKGDGDVIDIIAYVTEASAPISLQVYQPLGFDVSYGHVLIFLGSFWKKYSFGFFVKLVL